ncbi:putative NBD/HSP70 family sugar kinase [Arthrobacter stackebrandtii]|uniref:NBD/HSP70 family sugar kinase n=1 Tax=Arthrobacter stackebrandtii TaxID=272161 RepID=A0ABS4YYZ0_9MICC|nr:ROK family transcriptional regulator [Arthrobacter stackebrandtii]MBP2414002.1 putative NBD/HSP70 family sugar kinase [Arthrobacter stackebrandtii]PYG99012.1 sugar kinase [Arthrobacter stackebrandtii]
MNSVLFGHGRSLRASSKVLLEHVRGHNRSLVLQTLYSGGEQSRADLARQTRLTKVTVSDLVSELLADGLIIETGPRESGGPGKPSIGLDIARYSWHVIGIDLSDAESFVGALLDLDGQIIARVAVGHNGSSGAEAVTVITNIVLQLKAAATAPIMGVGVGTPGVVDLDGVIVSAPNLGWVGIDLRRELAAASGLTVVVANDANVAVLAEHTFGGVEDDLLLIRVGLGVGAGLLVNDTVVYGRDFAAGELGHVVVGTGDGPLCACGMRGCLEAWLNVPRLTAQINAIPSDSVDPAEDRAHILREAGRCLGIVLAPVVGALNINEIVLSGPIALLDGPLATTTVETIRSRSMAEFTSDLSLRMTSEGQDIVLRGAVVLVLSGQLGVS